MHTRFRFVTLVALCLPLALAGLPMRAVAAAPVTAPAASGALAFASDGVHFAGGWGMRLASYGRGDALTATNAVLPADDGNRVAYHHTGDVTEWYVRQISGDGNGADGMEQGVTLATRPAGDGPLVLTVVTAGAMALVDEGGATATLVLPDGARWGYTGLQVTDTTGRSLPAHLMQAAGGIGITVEDAGAVYPVVVDPFVQRQILTATGGASGDQSGNSVALSSDGNTALVGANGRSSNTGAAYVFTRLSGGGTYSQTQALTATGGVSNDYFGYSVALSSDGNTALIGAFGRSSRTGAAYVFVNPPALTSIAGTPQSATVTQPFATPLTVALTDGFGTPLAGVTVTFTAPTSGPGGTFGGANTATAVTDANGLATAPTFTANTAAGYFAVTASATTTGGTTTATFSLTNMAGAPASIAVVSGSNQTAQLGNAFAAPLTVQVRDQYTNPVPGATVTFAAPTTPNSPTATLGSPTAVTNGSGLASVTATGPLLGRPGIFTVTATVSGVTTPASFTLSDTANPMTTLITGFSPPTGPTSGGNTVTLTGVNFGGLTSVTFDTTAGTGVTVVNATTITVTAPAHAAGTVDITVMTNGQTATIHGYTYLNTGNIAPQPASHPLPGSGGSGGGLPIAQPVRHDDPGNGGGQPHTAGSATPTPEAQPARH